MTSFAIAVIVLILISAGLILRPLWLGVRQKGEIENRKAANLAILRQQMTELETEKAEGLLSEADFEQAKQELSRRLLEETDCEKKIAAASTFGSSPKAAIAILLLLPILSLLAYGYLGNPQALDPAKRERVAEPTISQEEIDGMLNKLVERLKANPDDTQGWLMLGRSYKVLGRYKEAVEAFAKVETVAGDDAEFLASYAETIAMSSENGLEGKPTELVEKALKLDPKNQRALFLAGAAAMEKGDKQKGIAYWETLLPLLEPGSEMERMVRGGIDQVKEAK